MKFLTSANCFVANEKLQMTIGNFSRKERMNSRGNS